MRSIQVVCVTTGLRQARAAWKPLNFHAWLNMNYMLSITYGEAQVPSRVDSATIGSRSVYRLECPVTRPSGDGGPAVPRIPQQTPRARASMADVGRVARVSAQTVSRYFTGSGYVGADTRVRIEAAISALDYRPNHTARNLRTRRSETVGVLAMGQSNFGLWSILAGLSHAARTSGYSLLIAQLNIDNEQPGSFYEVRHALDGFISSQVDGIVVSTPFLGAEELLDHVWDLVPVVSVSGRPWATSDAAIADSHAAGLIATRHLTALGHRRILHLGGPADHIEAFDRERGYLEALSEAGLKPLPLVRGDWSATSGHGAGLEVDPDGFSAVFAGNDQMALGFMSALRDRGRLAPDDYSIIGIDDMPDARYFAPPLSSVYLDFVALGETAFSMVLDRIETGERQDRRVIDPILVPRKSTAPFGGRSAAPTLQLGGQPSIEGGFSSSVRASS